MALTEITLYSIKCIFILLGRKWVHSTQLYLKYIDRQGGTDDEVAQLVKEYVKDIGIQILSANVISNRYDPEMVGCKIRVPNEEVQHALEDDIWPDVVECRKWSKGKPNRRWETENWDNEYK